MRPALKDKPREFGAAGLTIKDFGQLFLEAQEMVTLVSPGGRECDVTAMSWGFYLAPSLNARLRDQRFKTALVRNSQGRLFLNAVEMDKMALFEQYLTEQNSHILCWLDDWDAAGR